MELARRRKKKREMEEMQYSAPPLPSGICLKQRWQDIVLGNKQDALQDFGGNMKELKGAIAAEKLQKGEGLVW